MNKSNRALFFPEPSGPDLESSEEEDISDSQLCTAFKKTKYEHKGLVTHLTFRDKLDVLYAGFTAGQARAGCDSSYSQK